MWGNKESGHSLLTLVMSGAVALGTMVALTGQFARTGFLAKKTLGREDKRAIMQNIQRNISCSVTFKGKVSGAACTGGGYIDIKNRSGQVIIAANGTTILDGWGVLANCNNTTGLDVRAMKLAPGTGFSDMDWIGKSAPSNLGAFRGGELNTTPYSWAHPKARLFPLGDEGLCAEWFRSSISPTGCQKNQYPEQVDFANNTVTCKTIPSCIPPLTLEFGPNGYTCTDWLTQYINDTLIQPRITQLQNDLINYNTTKYNETYTYI
jgi:hypothetical protein